MLVLAHDKLGHLGARKVMKQRFTWPNMGRDIIDYCCSCEVCQRCSKAAARKTPLIEREVLSEPFECLALVLCQKGRGVIDHLYGQ